MLGKRDHNDPKSNPKGGTTPVPRQLNAAKRQMVANPLLAAPADVNNQYKMLLQNKKKTLNFTDLEMDESPPPNNPQANNRPGDQKEIQIPQLPANLSEGNSKRTGSPKAPKSPESECMASLTSMIDNWADEEQSGYLAKIHGITPAKSRVQQNSPLTEENAQQPQPILTAVLTESEVRGVTSNAKQVEDEPVKNVQIEIKDPESLAIPQPLDPPKPVNPTTLQPDAARTAAVKSSTASLEPQTKLKTSIESEAKIASHESVAVKSIEKKNTLSKLDTVSHQVKSSVGMDSSSKPLKSPMKIVDIPLSEHRKGGRRGSNSKPEEPKAKTNSVSPNPKTPEKSAPPMKPPTKPEVKKPIVEQISPTTRGRSKTPTKKEQREASKPVPASKSIEPSKSSGKKPPIVEPKVNPPPQHPQPQASTATKDKKQPKKAEKGAKSKPSTKVENPLYKLLPVRFHDTSFPDLRESLQLQHAREEPAIKSPPQSNQPSHKKTKSSEDLSGYNSKSDYETIKAAAVQVESRKELDHKYQIDFYSKYMNTIVSSLVYTFHPVDNKIRCYCEGKDCMMHYPDVSLLSQL